MNHKIYVFVNKQPWQRKPYEKSVQNINNLVSSLKTML